MNKQLVRGLLLITLIVVIASLTNSLSFIQNVSIGDGDTINDTSQIRKSGGLRCSWAYSSDVSNITVNWYNNSVLYDTITFTSGNLKNFTDLLPSALTETESWNCTVTFVNSTGSQLVDSATVEIIYDPSVYINTTGSYTLINNQSTVVYEDRTYSLIWNTTGTYTSETFTIGAPTRFCSDSSPATRGAGTCSPTNAYLTNSNTSRSLAISFQYDHESGTQKNTINFTIAPVNDAPTLTLTNTTINDSMRWDANNATFTVSDEEGNFPINFTIAIPSFCTSNTSSNAFSLNCSPTANDIGNFTINITALDNPPYNETYYLTPRQTNASFVLEVIAVNHQPNITFASNYNSSQGSYYNITINTSDIDNNSISVSITPNCNISNPWSNITNTTIITFDGENFTAIGYAIWNGTLNNSHIICRNITITASDGAGGVTTTQYILNISNRNDPPIIYNFSNNVNDPLGNNYINNYTGYESAPVIYQINATDPDLQVQYLSYLDDFNESLTYSVNDSWLAQYLNNNTGLISISAENMNLTAGNYTYLINVSDNGTPMYNRTVVMSIEILPNNAPYFLQALNFSCAEFDVLNYANSCDINLSTYVNDSDFGDSISNYSDTSNIINVSSSTGFITFNASQQMVGILTFNLTVSDSRGAQNTTTMTVYINNTNNRPNITNIANREPPVALYYNKSNNNKIAITVSDLDLNLEGTTAGALNFSYEALNFTWVNNNASQTLSNFIYFEPNITTNTSEIYLVINTTLLFNNTILSMGDYSINVTVTDNYENYTGRATTDSHTVMYNFTIYNTTAPPVITQINPYGTPWSNITVFAWQNITSDNTSTIINLTENTSVIINHTNTDDQGNLSYNWYYEGALLNSTTIVDYNSTFTLASNNQSITLDIGFFAVDSLTDGTLRNLTLVVIDGFDNTLNDTFTWAINYTNVNRPPVLNQPIPNITLQGTRNLDNRDLWAASDTYGFYDPDYDYDGDGIIEFTEGNFSLLYNVSDDTCGGLANINVTNPFSYIVDSDRNLTLVRGHGITATAVTNGTCNVTFTILDGEFNVTSNRVFFTVTASSSTATTTVTTTQSSGGGGTRTVTETVTIPVPEEVEVPVPIEIVAPDMVTVYENNLIEIPLKVTNTWDSDVTGIQLSYEIPNSTYEHNVTFERDNWYRISPGQIFETKMLVSNYRVGEIFEIIVIANVTDPPYEDSAKIYLNSIEQTSAGSTAKTLIRFATDILNQNKECQELDEILTKANNEYNAGNLQNSIKLIDSIINGCKYLISKEQIKESPADFRNAYIKLDNNQLIYLLSAILLAMLSLTIFSIIKKKV